jgi:hypothetical protein
MHIYHFRGRVFPLFKEFTLAGEIEGHLKEQVGGSPAPLTIDARLTITKAAINIICESNASGEDCYTRAYFFAYDLAHSVTGLYGFRNGLALSVLLETVTKPDGVLYNLHHYHPNLEGLVSVLTTQQDGGINIGDVLPIILSDPTIQVALTDLLETLEATREAPFRCGRAVDAIRHSMVMGKERKEGWARMRDCLNVSEEYLSFITEESKGPRHGDVKTNAWDASREILSRSWSIMNRFLEFKIRGSQPLPRDLFPLL